MTLTADWIDGLAAHLLPAQNRPSPWATPGEQAHHIAANTLQTPPHDRIDVGLHLRQLSLRRHCRHLHARRAICNGREWETGAEGHSRCGRQRRGSWSGSGTGIHEGGGDG